MRLFKQHLDYKSIVCVSGGCDSISAAHIMIRKYGINTIYHFNHGTPQADQMEHAVRLFCQDFNLNLIYRQTNQLLKTETEFRTARFAYFQNHPGNYVMAHNLDEAVESYCLKFFVGKPEYLPIPIITDLGNGGRILHPFLLVEKEQFRKYITLNKLEKYVVEDMSNWDVNSSRRAWIRHEFIPGLKMKSIGLKKIVRKKYLEKQ